MAATEPPAPHPIDALLRLMARLRDPVRGCPWDRAQDFRSIAPYTIEEAYEVAEAIEREDWDALRDELGDLLFQVVFHARMAEEGGRFDFHDVVRAICDKMERRHPHVFGNETIEDAAAQTAAWEAHKAAERGGERGVLDGVSAALPALTRAAKLQRRAARVGFDWPDIRGVREKVEEEWGELREAMDGNEPKERLEHELGDLLFACVNLARFLELDPEQTLRAANRRFEQRFRSIEARLREQGKNPADCTLEELDALWEAAK